MPALVNHDYHPVLIGHVDCFHPAGYKYPVINDDVPDKDNQQRLPGQPVCQGSGYPDKECVNGAVHQERCKIVDLFPGHPVGLKKEIACQVADYQKFKKVH
jgi:hypothetical protein